MYNSKLRSSPSFITKTGNNWGRIACCFHSSLHSSSHFLSGHHLFLPPSHFPLRSRRGRFAHLKRVVTTFCSLSFTLPYFRRKLWVTTSALILRILFLCSLDIYSSGKEENQVLHFPSIRECSSRFSPLRSSLFVKQFRFQFSPPFYPPQQMLPHSSSS